MVYRSAPSVLLVGVDGSAESSDALEWAAGAGARLDMLVVAVTTFEDLAVCRPGPAQRRERNLLARRERMITDAMDRHLEADISHWRVGGPLAACLCRLARADDVLVVPASRGPRGSSDLSEYCRNHAPCAVIEVLVDQQVEPQDRPLADGQEAAAEPATWLG